MVAVSTMLLAAVVSRRTAGSASPPATVAPVSAIVADWMLGVLPVAVVMSSADVIRTAPGAVVLVRVGDVAVGVRDACAAERDDVAAERHVARRPRPRRCHIRGDGGLPPLPPCADRGDRSAGAVVPPGSCPCRTRPAARRRPAIAPSVVVRLTLPPAPPAWLPSAGRIHAA
jgi:hypothetical protein